MIKPRPFQLLAALLLGTPAGAVTSVAGNDGPAWQAGSLIVGTASSTNISGGGNAAYLPAMPRLSGVAHITASFGAAGAGTCSGTLLRDRLHVVTAAHCFQRGPGGALAANATVRFYGGSNGDTLVSNLSGSSATHAVIATTSRVLHPDYTGEVVDQNDIAVVRLASAAPDWVRTYGLAPIGSLAGQTFEVAGYGQRSNSGGAVGANVAGGRLRSGDNRFDFRWGDPRFGGAYLTEFGTAPVSHSWLADFDSGLAANDASCIVAGICGLGQGLREVSAAPGDSGGPALIGDRLAALVSYGLSFGLSGGDTDAVLNSSFGELNGYVPLSLHRDFVTSVTGLSVPEPGSWAMLIAGFGLIGAAQRRQRRQLPAL